jgi:hypothetical protein
MTQGDAGTDAGLWNVLGYLLRYSAAVFPGPTRHRSSVEHIKGIPHSGTRSGFVLGEGQPGGPERPAGDGKR